MHPKPEGKMLDLNLRYDKKNNLIKMYSVHGEFDETLNSFGHRQNLIKKMALSIEWSAFNRSEECSRFKKPQVQIPEFSPSAAYKFEPANLHSSHRHDRRRRK